jgi:putative peptide zinc metalloprotease protein
MENIILTLIEYSIQQTDVSETDNQYVIAFANGRFIKVSENAKLIIDEVDGMRSFKEISDILNQKHQIDLSPEEIKKFLLTDLGSQGLIKGIEAQNGNTPSRLWIHFPLLDGCLFEKMAKALMSLFKRPVLLTILVAGIIIGFRSWVYFSGLTVRMDLSWLNVCVILFLYVICVVVHEMGHIAASYFWNIKPGKVGVGFYLFMPVFYIDLSQAWLLNKWQRAAIDASGFYFQIALLVFLFPFIFLNTNFLSRDNYHILVRLNLLTILFNLNPLIRGDGYWILSDLLGIVNLHQRTINHLVNFWRKIVHSPNYRPNLNCQLKSSLRMIFYLWSFGYIGMLLFILSRTVIMAFNHSTNGRLKPSWQMIVLFTLMAVYIIIPTVRIIRKKKN